MLVKVCGMTQVKQVAEISEISDYIGFIYYSKSPRFVSTAPKSKKAKRVGVFVNESLNCILDLIQSDQLDAVQLHGDETPEIAAALKSHVRVFKAFGMHDNFNFNSIRDYEGKVDYYLFDTKTPAYGGSGKKFQWEILNRYFLSTPFFLSGGLNLESLEEIQKIEHPLLTGVDINSGFEITPGVKKIKEIKQFIHGVNYNHTYTTR